MEAIDKVSNKYDRDKKLELVTLGNSPKKYSEILTYLENEITNSKRMTKFDHKIVCFKSDGIYQLHRAIELIIGATIVRDETQPSRKEVAIETIDIILADGSRKKVPYGKIDLPDMGDGAFLEILYSAKEKYMRVRGECQLKFQPLIDEIITKTHVFLNTDSIYKNQAFEINAASDDGQPSIMNLDNIDKEIMILSDEVEYALSPLKARILHAEKCIDKNIPLKFGCLLEGGYGL